MDHFGDDASPNMTSTRDRNQAMKKCRQRCELQSQEMVKTSSNYPNKLTLPFRKDYCYILKKMARVCQSRPGRRKEVLEEAYIIYPDLCIMIQGHLVNLPHLPKSCYCSLMTLYYFLGCLLYTSPSPRDRQKSRMPSSA